MLGFLLWSALYPASLYLFSHFSTERGAKIKTKVLATAVSCALFAWNSGFSFEFDWNWRLLLLMLTAAVPFLFAFEMQNCLNGWWRDFCVAPTIEEFYYRCLLPQVQENLLLNSLSFSLAHAHSLLFDRSNAHEISVKCLISYAFGLVVNWIRFRARVSSRNFWFFLSASCLHGLANYVGAPVGNLTSAAMTLICGLLLFYI
jgi:hypothetical protein